MEKGCATVKVFGVGLNKTGTTTLGQCGQILGFRCRTYSRALLVDFKKSNYQALFNAIEDADLFEDWPWPLAFREIDKAYPEAKFILTTRISPEKWYESLCAHSLRTDPFNHARRLAYGYSYPQARKSYFIQFYEDHNASVRSHFSGRPGKLLEVCWERGDGWREILNFLGCSEKTTAAFPHANKGASQEAARFWWRGVNQVLSVLRF